MPALLGKLFSGPSRQSAGPSWKDTPYCEEETLSDLKKALDEQGHSGAAARRRRGIMKYADANRSLGLKWPCFTPQALGDLVSKGGAEETKFFITMSRSGRRRLRLKEPCHVRPYHCSSVSFTDTVVSEAIDSVCRDIL